MVVRSIACLLVSLAAGALIGGCNIDMTSVCAIPPCGAPQARIGLGVEGFPAARVDRTTIVDHGFRGIMRPGDVVTLYLIRSLGPGSPGDTVRAGVAWALSDSIAAGVRVNAAGNAELVARAPGLVGRVIANGAQYTVWSCGGPYGGCDPLSGIAVVP